MAQLMVDFIASLDGWAGADGWPGFWGSEHREYLDWNTQDAKQDTCLLMGATTYRLMSAHAEQDPDELATAALTAADKVVFSSTLPEPLTWANSRLMTRDAVAELKDLKERTTGRLRTVGSVTLCRSLLSAGIVDRLRIGIFPVVTAATGRERILDGLPDLGLDLVTTRTLDGQIQILEYVPRALTEPPTVPT